jgi:hypothetical protein
MKRVVLSFLLCLIVLPLALTSYAHADASGRIINGQGAAGLVQGRADTGPAESLDVQLKRYLASDLYREHLRLIREAGMEPRVNASVVTFDASPAPCAFRDTSALRGSYQGVFFGARGSNGGAILNECGNFGVEAYSPPNYLAFNAGVEYPSGGMAALPQLLLFPATTGRVSLMISDGNDREGSIALVALGAGGVVGYSACQMAPWTWRACSVAAEGTRALLLLGSARNLVVDDIAY